MTASEKKLKRERAFYKMNNQISVLSRTAKKQDLPLVEELKAIVAKFSMA